MESSEESARDGMGFDFSKVERDLPVYQNWETIKTKIDENPVSILVGATGTGKSTQIPQLLLREGLRRGQNPCIIITQPRRLAAMSIADMICKSRGWQLGGPCGYQVSRDRRLAEGTMLQYVTTNVLVERFIHKTSNLSKFTHILVDEIHERTQDLDCLLYLLKTQIEKLHPDLRIILMSATTESELYRRYFGAQPSSVIQIEGRQFSVTEHYLDDLPPELREKYVQYETKRARRHDEVLGVHPPVVDIVFDLICSFDGLDRNSERGAVLVFVPGMADVRLFQNIFGRKPGIGNFVLLPLHSKVPLEDQRRAFARVERSKRKIIVATNIAESSITVPDIKFVIDFCLTKHQVLHLDSGFVSYVTEHCSKASCNQRAGRAGRVQNGVVYRLLRKREYAKLPEFSSPEILRSSIDISVLKIKLFGLKDPQKVLSEFITPPDAEKVRFSIIKLKEVQALQLEHEGEISLEDGDLTILGRVMASLPLDVRLSKLVMMGYAFGCFEECVKMAACSTADNFCLQDHDMMASYKNKLHWAKGHFSDPILEMNIFDEYLQVRRNMRGNYHAEKDWAEENNLNHRRLVEAHHVYGELKQRLLSIGIEQPPSPNLEPREPDMQHFFMLIAICGAFYPNYFVQPPQQLENSKVVVGDHDPRNTLVVSGLPFGLAPVFAQYIRAALKDVITSEYKLSFKDIDAFLTFENSPTIPYDFYICEMFLRQNKFLEIPRIREEHAEELLKRSNISEFGEDTLIIVPNEGNIKLAKTPLPSTRKFAGTITKFEDLLTFYFRMESRSSTFRTLCNEIADQISNHDLVKLKKPNPGTLVLVGDQQDAYRARVISRQRKICKVLYIDYGIIAEHDVVYCLPETMLVSSTQAPFAYKARLINLETLDGVVGSPADFQRLSENTPCDVELFSVVDDVMLVKVSVERDSVVYDMSEKLVHSKKAVYIDQNFDEKQLSTDVKKDLSWSEAVEFSVQGEAFAFPNEDLGNQQLYGPRSPLCITGGLRSLTKRTEKSIRTVEIAQDSVNQVFFGETDSTKRFLVSLADRMTADKERLQLLKTCLISKLPMMLPFVATVFCPRAEYRVNKKVTGYTGAICGLGCKLVDGKWESVYPEGDLEIDFPKVIKKRSATIINHIRRLLNEAFCGNNESFEWHGEPLLRIQQKISRLTLDFFKLDQCEDNIPDEDDEKPKSFKWGLLPAAREDDGFGVSKRSLYRPHETTLLYNAAMLELLSMLRSFMECAEPSSTHYPRLSMCPLCSKFFEHHKDVMNHLDDPEHLERYNLLTKDRGLLDTEPV